MPMAKLAGVVMCGGKSQRMGTDKGLIPINNTCWAGFMGEKLSAVCLPFYVSVNSSQIEKYKSLFSNEQLVVDCVEINGPLAGLISIHSQYPEKDLLFLACDMIDMQAETLDRLIRTYTDEPIYDFYVYQNRNYAEPFCAIYTGRALKKLLQNQEVSLLSNLSLQKVLNQFTTKRLDIFEPVSFNNHNTL